MRYCRRCLIPDTKPHVVFDADGVCNACLAHDRKNGALAGIDWSERERMFAELVDRARARQAPYYDAVVPVSGGKDSITQVARLLAFDVRILAVNVDYGVKTEIGRENLACIPAMGASLLTYRPEEQLHKRLIRIGLEDFGDPDLLSHTLLHAYPLHVALKFGVPLVLLGENSAAEYGGDGRIASETDMSRSWFDKFAANDGHDARYVSERFGISFERLRLYDYPDELAQSGTRATFCSHYFHWDSERHLEIAQRFGFRTLPGPAEGTYRNYVGIDERINRIHQYLKVLKFGYGRATDHACEDIRNGRLTREEAVELVRRHDLEPLSHAATAEVVSWLGYNDDEFLAIIERYRNTEIWQQSADGAWYIPHHLEDVTWVH
jgi:N-acetyl sugar amidotransferase